jgi:hypothetical protein
MQHPLPDSLQREAQTTQEGREEGRQMSATYAESVGGETFNWLAFLDARINVEDAGEWEISDNEASDLAGDWPTCACGNQCSIIPRGILGAPEDHELRSLGNLFFNAVDSRDWAAAKTTFLRIEKRSAELIAELATPQRKPQKRRAG